MKIFRHLFWICAFFCAFCLGVSAKSNNTIRLSYLQDPSHQIEITELSRQNFNHIPSDFALGFTHATTWLKIETTITPESGSYFLSLWPPRLENCQLFAQSNTNNNFVEIHSTPEGKRLGNVFYDTFKRHVFDLSAFRDTHVFYLKVISDNSLIGNVSLLTNQNIDLHRANEGFLLGGVAFGLVPFLLIFLALAIYKKEPIYLVYFFSLLTTTFLYLSIYGFGG